MDEESTRLRPDLPSPRAPVAAGTIDRRRGLAGRERNEDEEEPSVELSRLRSEIDATRDQLGMYLSELDRRRHDALDLKQQMKKHPGLAVGAGVAIVGAVAGAVVMAIRARRRETVGRKVRGRRTGIANAPAPAPANPASRLGLLLKASLAIGVVVATRLLAGEKG